MKKTILLFSLILLAIPGFSQGDLTALIDKVSPAIFKITTYDAAGAELNNGTGFFINSSGSALTNYSVLKGATKAKVKTKDGKTYLVGNIISWSPENDMVKLSIKNELNEVFPYLKISPLTPKVGEKIFVMGNPLDADMSVNDGIVSQNRIDNKYGDVIQVTAPISQGNSGSPLLNMSGEVFGIVYYFKKGESAPNFAVSVKNMNTLEDVNSLKFPPAETPIVDDDDDYSDNDPHSTMYYIGSKVILCEDVDQYNDPKNEGTTFSKGKLTVYVDNGSKPFGSTSLTVTYYKKNSAGEKVYLSEETYTIKSTLVATWWDHSFNDPGDYVVSVKNGYDAWVNDGDVTITSGGDTYSDPSSTLYYLYSKVIFCEGTDSNNDPKNASSLFSKGTLTVYVDNANKQFATTSLKVYYYKKSGGDYVKIKEESYTIKSTLIATWWDHSFTEKGDYKVEVRSGSDVWVNTGYVTIK